MNGTNKAAVGVVFGIALAYAALSLVLTLMGILDTGTVSIILFFPLSEGMGIDLSEIEGVDVLIGYYSDLIGRFGDDRFIAVALVAVGFVISVAGMFTSWSIGVKGEGNPAEYLWTMRPKAMRGLFAAWGILGACWSRSKPLVILPVILLPFYLIWSVLITVVMLVPFLIVKAVIGGRVRKASKKESSAERTTICPKCKRNFATPKVKCNCGLVLDYPVPNQYGYRFHTCHNGHQIPCVRGKRADLNTVCPFCDSYIEAREANAISIAMVGAVGSGKTSLMLASVSTITQVARSKDVAVEAITPGVDKQAVAAKDVAPRTVAGELDSECLFLRSMDMTERQIVFNDISGSEFEPKDGKVLFEEYYTYSDGIVFTFDPVALLHGRNPSPMDVFESFHSMFCQINGVGPSSVSKIPFAVVATKTDIVSPQIKSADVRRFLVENGQEGFVKVLEAVFSDVRYFASSSRGEDCRTAAAPVWWIVGKRDKELASKVPVLSQ